MRSPTGFLAGTLVVASLAVGSVAHANEFTYDHLKCFKIRDSLVERRTVYLADLFPDTPFAARTDCRLHLPAQHFCVNVEKQNVIAPDPDFQTIPVPSGPARDYLCYRVKCDRDRPDLRALDQFGGRPLRVKRSDFLCMPANKILTPPSPTPPPTETPTPTPTKTPLPNPCRLLIGPDNGRVPNETCGGDCPTDQICAFTGSTATDGCECRPELETCRPLATTAIDGICGGLCPSPADLCADVVVTGAEATNPLGECECVSLQPIGCELMSPRGPTEPPLCGGPCEAGFACAASGGDLVDGCACVPELALCGTNEARGICAGACPSPQETCRELPGADGSPRDLFCECVQDF